MQLTKKKVFMFGIFWLVLFYCFFVADFIKEQPNEKYSSYTSIVGSLSQTLCVSHNNYSCWGNVQNIAISLWMLLSVFFIYLMEHTRRKVFLFGIIPMVFLLFLSFIQEFYPNVFSSHFFENLAGAMIPFLLIIPISIVLTLFRDEVFIAWWRFSRIWIPIISFLSLITPTQSSWMMSWDSGATAFVLSIPYFFISVVVIISKFIELRKK